MVRGGARRARGKTPGLVLWLLVLVAALGVFPPGAQAAPSPSAQSPIAPSPTAQAPTTPAVPRQAIVYFFWGDGCPHCAAAKPVLADLQARTPGLVLRDFEVYHSPENQRLFAAMAARLGFQPSGVPTLILGDRYWVGFAAGRTDVELAQAVAACLAGGCPDAGAGLVSPLPATPGPGAAGTPTAPSASGTPAPEASGGVVDLPFLGPVDLSQQSLVVTTLLIAAVDGVNPCSLWVLTILIALALRTGSRRLTLLIGLVFIAVTALVYGLFIAGLFSVLTALTVAPGVRVLVALIAAAFAVVNIKDYFWFKRGVSLTIPDDQKPGIYQRMRAIVRDADNLPALVAGTAALAAGVSVIELACTAGFPVVWTNILTAHQVGPAAFVGLLLLYLLVYQLDELLIFGSAVVTLRATKLQERQGRVLKLVGGVLMLTLAVVMIVDPTLLSGLASSLAVFGIALGATVLVLVVHRVILPRLGVRTPDE
nr:thioredoxin family protein [Propionibacterium sp.]